MSEQPEKLLNISDISARLQAIIHNEMVGDAFWVGGMVKKVYEADSGYVYFDLVDDPFSIRCIVHKNIKGELAFTVSNNIEVEVFGEIRFYERRTKVEVNVQKIRLVESALVPPNPIDVDEYLRKRGLAGLSGYQSKPIPSDVKRIFLLTSSSSKALDDFKYTYTRKADSQKAAQIIHEDIPLKGEYAPKQIAEVITRVNAMSNAGDVIVITRGGGRKSELGTFNDLMIAEAMRHSDIPIVTGIGHQKDNVLADMIADVSAITPTDAADKIIEAQKNTLPPCAERLIALFGVLSLVSSLVLWVLIFMTGI